MTIIAEPEQIGFDGPRAEGESSHAPPEVRAAVALHRPCGTTARFSWCSRCSSGSGT